MRSIRLTSLPLLAGALAMVALGACGGDDDDGAGAAPTSGDLDGNSFVATDITPQGIVEGSEVVVTFEDGSVVVSAGCNTQRGGYTVADGVLTMSGPMMATMMACEDALMAQDTFLAGVFDAGPTLGLDGDQLTITTADTTITLKEQ